jgi:glycosyltransferase involved in cell wall biosynthesis
MIVKNESRVIQRCLASVQSFVDFWVIVDTGSMDGTQRLIQKFMKRIPGELHERSWVNFEHNRNEAFMLARSRADYTLFIDADEKLVVSHPFQRPALDKDCYRALVHTSLYAGLRMLMVDNRLDWRWKGVLHEELQAPNITSYEDLANVIVLANTLDGHRSQDPQKHIKDALVLEKALETDPQNSRYLFYLAQSYANAKEYPLALKYYEQRAAMGGNVDEMFWSLYMVGMIQGMLQYPIDTVFASLWKAHYYQPKRAEPLYHIARLHFDVKNYSLAYLFSSSALSLSFYRGTGYVVYRIYDYELPLLFADAAIKVNKLEEARATYQKLLQSQCVPQNVREEVMKGMAKLL